MGDNLEWKHRLVVFLGDKTKSQKQVIDIVPSEWIYADNAYEELRCKFMPEKTYNDKNLKLLNEMVKKCVEPCSDWPSYSVEIRGRARSYEEAEKLMDKLQYQPYAYSTDNEASAKNKAKNDNEYFKSKNLSPNNAKNLLNDATLDLTADLQLTSETRGKKRKASSSEDSSGDHSIESSSSEEDDHAKRKHVTTKLNKKIVLMSSMEKTQVLKKLLAKVLTKLLAPLIKEQKALIHSLVRYPKQ
ncbi:uncharacterized protein LOC141537198 [Cotesia typhae]|uniref:uncharacterized protein LOC141537198 n=1 Tax=Cotesia typhae TaxID=2053667 RepID=UPI003D6875C9